MSLLISQLSCDSELENRVKVQWCCDLDYNVLLGCPKINTVCTDCSKSHQICRCSSMNKHFFSLMELPYLLLLLSLLFVIFSSTITVDRLHLQDHISFSLLNRLNLKKLQEKLL